ncbi:hypothetical protein GALL_417190 [mine drainage metagenome]|uniref:Uncharacterized protein n=1 Tax=mine drainage metagenome TaxID=410659 RepID=A0A1J5Q9N0_9ZZZZ
MLDRRAPPVGAQRGECRLDAQRGRTDVARVVLGRCSRGRLDRRIACGHPAVVEPHEPTRARVLDLARDGGTDPGDVGEHVPHRPARERRRRGDLRVGEVVQDGLEPQPQLDDVGDQDGRIGQDGGRIHGSQYATGT